MEHPIQVMMCSANYETGSSGVKTTAHASLEYNSHEYPYPTCTSSLKHVHSKHISCDLRYGNAGGGRNTRASVSQMASCYLLMCRRGARQERKGRRTRTTKRQLHSVRRHKTVGYSTTGAEATPEYKPEPLSTLEIYHQQRLHIAREETIVARENKRLRVREPYIRTCISHQPYVLSQTNTAGVRRLAAPRPPLITK